MATLLNLTHPAFEVYDPADGSWTKFINGRLDIEEDDPHFAAVMAEAARNPFISVHNSVFDCVHCGEPFKSKAALEAHVKDIHFDKWLADEDGKHAAKRDELIKSRAGVVCDACNPPQTFPDEDALAAHVAVMHTARPDESEGDGGGADDSGASSIDKVKAAAAGGAAKRRSRGRAAPKPRARRAAPKPTEAPATEPAPTTPTESAPAETS